MATKDWTKDVAPMEGNYLFINKHIFFKRISVFRNYPMKSFSVKVWNSQMNIIIDKTFNIKSQALKFAHQYMRTH